MRFTISQTKLFFCLLSFFLVFPNYALLCSVPHCIHRNSNDSGSGSGNGATSYGSAESGPFPLHFLCLTWVGLAWLGLDCAHTDSAKMQHELEWAEHSNTLNIITQIMQVKKERAACSNNGRKKRSAEAFISVGLIVIYRVNQSDLQWPMPLVNVPHFQLYEFRHTRVSAHAHTFNTSRREIFRPFYYYNLIYRWLQNIRRWPKWPIKILR